MANGEIQSGGSVRVYGLIGYPLGHSFSQKYFNEKFEKEYLKDASFSNFEVEHINAFPELVSENPNLRGLSVTIPHKESIIDYLDELDDGADQIGAVNSIKISSSKRIGYNTDYIGFLRSLSPLLSEHHQKALILGTGGASKAVVFALEKLGIGYDFVSRNPQQAEFGYQSIDQNVLSEHLLIINTTPLGMYPEIDAFPDIPYEQLTERHLLYDLVYNPEETLFLKKGKENNAATKNGYDMLIYQAEESWRIWNDF